MGDDLEFFRTKLENGEDLTTPTHNKNLDQLLESYKKCLQKLKGYNSDFD